jgi:HAD superfamily hydrolase (TIGR01509 family)
MPQIGFIFDWDGVVVDSSNLHEKSWNILAKEINLPLPDAHFKKGFGKRNSVIIPEILGWSQEKAKIEQWGKRKEEIYRELGEKSGIQIIDGIHDFLKEMKLNNISAVIGTSTDRENIELAFGQLGIENFFLDAICAEDVSQGKPHPEVFLKGADLLGLPPEQCVVFEDSLHGIEAATRGGMKAVAITTSQPASLLQEAGADLIVDSPIELTVNSLVQLFD